MKIKTATKIAFYGTAIALVMQILLATGIASSIFAWESYRWFKTYIAVENLLATGSILFFLGILAFKQKAE